QAVDFAGLAGEADVIYGADFAALLVLEALGQGTSFDHEWTPRLQYSKDRAIRLLSLLRVGRQRNYDCREVVALISKAVRRGHWVAAARILDGGWRIFNILEMGHLFGTKMEKAACLLLE